MFWFSLLSSLFVREVSLLNFIYKSRYFSVNSLIVVKVFGVAVQPLQLVETLTAYAGLTKHFLIRVSCWSLVTAHFAQFLEVWSPSDSRIDYHCKHHQHECYFHKDCTFCKRTSSLFDFKSGWQELLEPSHSCLSYLNGDQLGKCSQVNKRTILKIIFVDLHCFANHN
jgi:hypothetical protein